MSQWKRFNHKNQYHLMIRFNSSLLVEYDIVIIDLNGTFYDNFGLYDRSLQVLKFIRENCTFVALTNTDSRNKEDLMIKPQIKSLGLKKNEIYSVVDHLYTLIESGVINPVCFTTNSVAKRLPKTTRTPDSVVLGDVRDLELPSDLNKVLTLILKGLKFYILQEGHYYESENGFELDTGAYGLMLQEITGKKYEILGKPNPSIVEEAVKFINQEMTNKKVVIIGDEVNADVKVANELGIDSVLVRTGKSRGIDLSNLSYQPTYWLDKISDLLDK